MESGVIQSWVLFLLKIESLSCFTQIIICGGMRRCFSAHSGLEQMSSFT